MLLLIYLKISILLAIIIYCGVNLFRRTTEEKRAEVVIPSGIIIGIAIYIFLLNLVAHFLKGIPGFYLALLIELILTFVAKTSTRLTPLLYPVGRNKTVWRVSLTVWSIFLYIITSTGPALSGDASSHYILASLFLRGDYPIHSPFQPDFIAYYHVGAAELFGAFKGITAASFELLFSLFSFISLLSISQILTFILKPNPDKPYSVILSFLIPIIAIISLGEFIIVWPFVQELPDIQGNFVAWLGQLPLWGSFGASTSLDSFSLFIHRMLSIASFIGLLPIILYPKIKSYILPAILIGVTLTAIALTDESVFIIVAPAIFIFTLFAIFRWSFLKWIIFCLVVTVITVTQGGFITVSLFNKNENSQVLIFPQDETGPLGRYARYRSYRLNQMKDYIFADRKSYHPFRFFHPGIFWQLGFLLSLSVITFFLYVYKKNSKDLSLIKLLLFLLSSSVCALIAFNAFVPRGMYHINGTRLLGMSYHLSGLGIAFFVTYWWINTKVKIPILQLLSIVLKIAIIWVLFWSIIISLTQSFPRQKMNFFTYNLQDPPLYDWIRENIPLNKKIIMLTDVFPTSTSNTDLIMKVGTLTPVWTSEYLATGFDTNPTYSDLFYTINPQLLKILKMDYIVIGDQYLKELSKISPKRIQDLKNPDFFQVVMRDDGNNLVLRILPKYLSEGENLHGTFYELRDIAPKIGSYFMEGYPNIAFGFNRSAQLALYDREIYYDDNMAPAYAFVIDVDFRRYEGHKGPYDYLILGENTNPKTICHCNTKLLWEGLGNGINLWKVTL